MKMRLRACRVQAGLLIKEAAELIGVTPATVSSWERGSSSPDMDKSLKMSLVYRIPLEYMDFSKSGNTDKIREVQNV